MYKIIGADHVEYGPVSAGQVQEWIAQGRANAASLVQAEGATDWKPLSAMPEFAAALGSSLKTPQVIAPTIVRRPRTNGLAIAGFILGILSILLFWVCLFNLVLAVLGLIFSCLGLSQIKKNPAQEKGGSLAVAGIVLSCLGLVLGLLVVLFMGWAFAAGNHAN